MIDKLAGVVIRAALWSFISATQFLEFEEDGEMIIAEDPNELGYFAVDSCPTTFPEEWLVNA